MVALAAALLLWLPFRTRSDFPPAHLDLLITFCSSAPRAFLWLAAAIGFGRPLVARLAPRSADRAYLQCALGVAALLTIDAALARSGLLDELGGGVAWGTLALGALLLIDQLRRFISRRDLSRNLALSPFMVMALPAAIVLLFAACSAPGLLWASEFGGYDALSYHLQLPKEWISLGRADGLTHNVYSFLPSYVECAFLHMMLLRTDPILAVCDAQILHAGMTVLAAVIAGRLAFRIAGHHAGAFTAVLVLGTPWTIVVGSLAYNEMAVALALAGGLMAIEDDCLRATPVRRGMIVGLLAAGACGAKLTAFGFAAIPLGVLLIGTAGSLRRAIASAAFAIFVGSAILLPYLFSNWNSSGNPVFPFATAIFGEAHWTAEQIAAWRRGHFAALSHSERLSETWNQWLRYGIGLSPFPYQHEPWKPQWSVLPIVGLVCAVVLLLRGVYRGVIARLLLVVILQLAFWMLFTHMKSRFMVPAIMPLAMIAAITVGPLVGDSCDWSYRSVRHVIVALCFLLYSLQPVLLFLSEGKVRSDERSAPASFIGAIDDLTGDSLAAAAEYRNATREEPRALLEHRSLDVWLNHWVEPSERVLCVGYSVPFYCRSRNLHYQTTWDRGPLSRIMREVEDESHQLAALADEGFDFLVVDFNMLDRWSRAGWSDPLLTVDRIRAATRATELVHAWPNGQVLYDLRALASHESRQE